MLHNITSLSISTQFRMSFWAPFFLGKDFWTFWYKLFESTPMLGLEKLTKASVKVFFIFIWHFNFCNFISNCILWVSGILSLWLRVDILGFLELNLLYYYSLFSQRWKLNLKKENIQNKYLKNNQCPFLRKNHNRAHSPIWKVSYNRRCPTWDFY